MKRSKLFFICIIRQVFDRYLETGWIGLKAGTNQLFKASFCRTRIPIVRLPEDLINSAQELLDSITNQSTIRTSALGLYSKYQLTGLKKTLELDQKEILIKYLDLLQNQAIKDSELKKKNSNDGDGEGRAFGLFLGRFDSGKLDPSKDKDSEVLSLKEEAERVVNEKALAKVASIMSNPSQRTSFDDKPLPPVKESPKAPPPPRTRDKVMSPDSVLLASSFI
ncbi:hypothetical protein PPACK8108_LOCUS1509 [Phakopsora pachyrhizi]|uniref:Uncharacterized protein n=1 Tax=Phakopsora pachyrhizi TaxID=170000 RepID=A0AAV0AIF6_PHAPC|nr:hypothetical protein PPACK8108_LOCUS1509 [Phakopsora pachyrhizi]